MSYATSILDIIPGGSNPIALSTSGKTYLTYTIKNNTPSMVNTISIDPGYGGASNELGLSLTNDECSGTTLAARSSCSFVLSIHAQNQPTNITLMPRVCAFKGAICSTPLLSNRVMVTTTPNLPNNTFPTPYAGTFYPLYNSGPDQWLPPTNQFPFNKVSAIFAAFAHVYPLGNGAIFTYETGQPEEPARLSLLVQSARAANPSLKILISLGWDKNDWTYINTDYVNHANLFIPSVIEFIRMNQLDGLDIDDEGIGGGSGVISQANFDGVVANLRNALNYASLQDGKPYYLTITPAGNNQAGGIENTQIDQLNASSFNLVNIQTYYNGSDTFGEDLLESLLSIGYPAKQIANGIDTKESCTPIYPAYLGLAGLFNWNMTIDSTCSNFSNTQEIANLVGYSG